MSEDQTIERLLRLAASSELPPGGEERIRAAVRPLWKQQVRRRSIRRGLTFGMFAAAAAVALFFVIEMPRMSEPVVPATAVATVELSRGPLDPAFRQGKVFPGAWLHTSPSSRVSLRIIDGPSLRIDNDTTLRLASNRIVELRRGAVYIESGGAGNAVEVRTPFGSVRDIGTRFEVRVQSGLTVRVREGSVDLSTKTNRVRVMSGFESNVAADGVPATASLRSEEESWTAAIAPPFAIEGQSMAALLEYCSRESGLPLRYDEGVERVARATLLHGSMSEQSPVDTAAEIAPTAGLRVTPSNGALVVSRLAP